MSDSCDVLISLTDVEILETWEAYWKILESVLKQPLEISDSK